MNAPSRIHYGVNQHGEDDLLFQIDGGHFRLYEPEKDPQPIYTSLESKKVEEINEETPEAASDTQTGFAYESDLRDFLSRNLFLIEPGLHLYEEEGITGIEFPVGGRSIDILAVDQQKNYVVIELKVSRAYDRVIGQLLWYMAWIEKNQAEPAQKVRGVIIAREITDDLFLAASKIPDVKLFDYDLSVTLKPVN